MSSTNTTAAIAIALVSIVVALRIDTPMPGGADTDVDTTTQTSTTSVSARQEPATERRTAIHAETETQRRLIEWALQRFEQAGLELPPVTIYTHAAKQDCSGLNGYFSSNGEGIYEVHSCGVGFTLLHELAHAWADHSLADGVRDRFMEIADADEWIGSEWRLSASEHAANVVAWGLMDERINQTRTRPYDYASMLGAFTVLTGSEPLWVMG